MKHQRIIAMAGILIIAALLAFPLRGTVFRMLIVPLAYVFWVLGLLYRAVHQSIWWAAALLLTLFILVQSLFPKVKPAESIRHKTKPVIGQVESLAVWLKKTERGTYFKWLIAHRLGRIAHQILENRATGKPRSFFDPLTGPDWAPDPSIQAYLEAGLKGSFADYPQKARWFTSPAHTPLDHDVKDVIQFLESQTKNK
jgi:hypothetical protein